MCGFVGSISREKPKRFGSAVEALKHRGPDSGSIEQLDVSGWTVSLGHRRLSIIDLSIAANQPFASSCGNYVIVFNGEIYNHVALRESLAAEGCYFRTRSDTEVLLVGLMREGVSFLTKVNGMFALAFLDKCRGRLTLARDPFGIKPLYVHRHNDGGVTFASEIYSVALAAGLSLEPDETCIAEFLLNGFLYEPATGFKTIEKVPPGSILELNINGAGFSSSRFYDPLNNDKGHSSLDTLLTDQVGLEVEADVPVGLFFSGGVDSAVILAAAPRNVEAFFVDYGDEQAGDLRYAEAIAAILGTPLKRVHHREDATSAETIIAEFRAVARGTEEPISDYTYVATRAISRLAREAGFKVMLSGMGGDELFAGYPRHAAARLWPSLRWAGPGLGLGADMLARLPGWSKRASRLKAFLSAPDFAQGYSALVGYFTAEEIARMTGTAEGSEAALSRIRALLKPVEKQSFLRQAMFLDRSGFLAHNLTVTDRASMAESVEVRVPLLNTPLEAFVSGLSDSALMRRRSGKLPLKAYLAQRLPAELVYRPKVGFNPPLDRRIAKIGRSRCTSLITSGKIAATIDPDVTRVWLAEHFEGRANHTYRIWQLIYLALWLEEWQ